MNNTCGGIAIVKAKQLTGASSCLHRDAATGQVSVQDPKTGGPTLPSIPAAAFFSATSTNVDLYTALWEAAVAPFLGISSTILSYGQVGSGKSSVLGLHCSTAGWDSADPGLLPRVLKTYEEMADALNVRGVSCRLSLTVEQMYRTKTLVLLPTQPFVTASYVLAQVSSCLETAQKEQPGVRCHTFVTVKVTTLTAAGTPQSFELLIADLAGFDRSTQAVMEPQRQEDVAWVNSSMQALCKMVDAAVNNSCPGKKKVSLPISGDRLTVRLAEACQSSNRLAVVACVCQEPESSRHTHASFAFARQVQQIQAPVLNSLPGICQIRMRREVLLLACRVRELIAERDVLRPQSELAVERQRQAQALQQQVLQLPIVRGQLQSATAKAKKLEAVVEQLQKELQAAKEDASSTALKQAMAAMEQKLAQHQSVQAENNRLKGQLSHLTQHSKELQQKLERSAAELKEKQTAATAQQAALAAAETKIAQLALQLQQLQNQLATSSAQHQKQLAAAQSAVAPKEALQKLQERAAQLETDNMRLKKQVESMMHVQQSVMDAAQQLDLGSKTRPAVPVDGVADAMQLKQLLQQHNERLAAADAKINELVKQQESSNSQVAWLEAVLTRTKAQHSIALARLVEERDQLASERDAFAAELRAQSQLLAEYSDMLTQQDQDCASPMSIPELPSPGIQMLTNSHMTGPMSPSTSQMTPRVTSTDGQSTDSKSDCAGSPISQTGSQQRPGSAFSKSSSSSLGDSNLSILEANSPAGLLLSKDIHHQPHANSDVRDHPASANARHRFMAQQLDIQDLESSFDEPTASPSSSLSPVPPAAAITSQTGQVNGSSSTSSNSFRRRTLSKSNSMNSVSSSEQTPDQKYPHAASAHMHSHVPVRASFPPSNPQNLSSSVASLSRSNSMHATSFPPDQPVQKCAAGLPPAASRLQRVSAPGSLCAATQYQAAGTAPAQRPVMRQGSGIPRPPRASAPGILDTPTAAAVAKLGRSASASRVVPYRRHDSMGSETGSSSSLPSVTRSSSSETRAYARPPSTPSQPASLAHVGLCARPTGAGLSNTMLSRARLARPVSTPSVH